MNRKLFIVFFINLFFSAEKIDVNTATSLELSTLSINENKIIDIKKYIEKNGHIDDIFELINIESISSNDIHILKEQVMISNEEIFNKNYVDKFSFKLNNWVPDGENSDGINDLLIHRYINKMNINEMSFDDFIILPNVSPIDVFYVMEAQDRGEIDDFGYRNISASYYGKKNLKDFVVFDNKDSKKINVRYNLMYTDLPSSSGIDEDAVPLNFRFDKTPETLAKLFISSTSENSIKYNFGSSRFNNLGDPYNVYSKKTFFSIENINLINSKSDFKIDKIILGNFSASYGLGVIFDSSDSAKRKNTSYGFNKNLIGVHHDFSRSSQYVLSGYAFQISNRKFRFSFFNSNGFLNNNNKRDAIINEDGSFTSLISMKPRLPYGLSNNQNEIIIHESLVNSVEERTVGGNLRISLNNSFSFEITSYQSMYDKELIPQITETMTDDYGAEKFEDGYMSNSADPEAKAMYENSSSSDLWWGHAKSKRRVFGGGFTKILGQLCFQGEYGAIDLKNEENPEAYVLNTYISFDSFNLLILFRDYDIAYDNSYQRSFSNYTRYKATILEDDFELQNPYYANLAALNPQPQAEKGVYINSRYEFLRGLTTTLELDSWVRKADREKFSKVTTTLEWQPLFNYRIKFRYQLQSRGGGLHIGPSSAYFIKNARLTFRLNLSNYDKVEFLYLWSDFTSSPRPRLTTSGNPFVTNMTQGDLGVPDKAIGFSYDHNFNKYFKVKMGIAYIGGYLWYIEDNDFRMFSDEAMTHNWISFNIKPNDMYIINLKMSQSSSLSNTSIPIANTLKEGFMVINPYVFDESFNYKLQINYAF